MTANEVVRAYWDTMATNDFYKASEWLAEDFECYWPQSSELIIGRENFALINSLYPVNGKWSFEVNSIIGDESQVVTDVSVSDEKSHARAITFHSVENNLIVSQKEYWPDSFEPPLWRRKWVKIVS